MTKKLTKKEKDEFEYMCNLDPTTVFYEPSSDYKLFIYKKLLFAEEQTSYMGMELSHLSFHNTSYEKILNTLYYLQQNKIINIINYDIRKQNIINENGISHEALLPKNNTKFIDLVFKYEIINEKKLLEIIVNDISEFQNDIIYDLLHERCNKNFLKSCKENNVSLPYLQQKKETIKILNKINHNKIGYFKWDVDKCEDLRYFAVLLALEKEGAIEILDVGIYSDGHTVIDIKQKELFERKKFINKKKISQDNDLEIEIEHNNLSYWSDGTIRFKNEIIDLAPKIKELCIFFLEKYNKLESLENIDDAITPADKRGHKSYANIPKYISALRNSLKIHFKKNVIHNEGNKSWYMKI